MSKLLPPLTLTWGSTNDVLQQKDDVGNAVSDADLPGTPALKASKLPPLTIEAIRKAIASSGLKQPNQSDDYRKHDLIIPNDTPRFTPIITPLRERIDRFGSDRVLGADSSADCYVNTPHLSLMPYVIDNRETLTKEKLEATRLAIKESLDGTMEQIMSKNKATSEGIWYPDDFKLSLESKAKKMPDDYWTGYADPSYFDKSACFTFTLKEGKSAAGAVRSLLKGPSILDCGNATQLAYYKAILDVLGEKKFDALFSSELSRLRISQLGIADLDAPISLLADYTVASKARLEGSLGHRPLELGEECYFGGVRWYSNKHPKGFAGGWNVVCVGKNEQGEQLFAAHGFDKPMSEREIHRMLLKLYNRERSADDNSFIQEQNQAHLYDRDSNGPLRSLYTIPSELADTAVSGFLVGSCRAIDYESLVKAQSAEITPDFILSLFEARVIRSLPPS